MDRILVVLPNWFGETLFTTPFLRALRHERHHAWIATLGRPACREVLLHLPYVNELLDYDELGTHRGLAGKWRLIRLLRAQGFDGAFILRRSLSRTLLMALAGIPMRIGFGHPKSGWLLTTRVRPRAEATHKALGYLALLEAFGYVAAPGPYDYAVSEPERQAARAFLAREGLGPEEPLVILHPGANWVHKRWPPERFAEAGDRLAQRERVRLAITGGPHDVELAEEIRRRMRHPATVLAGRTTLRQLAACLEQAQLVISHDTGVLHIAAALGRPVVALYGPTSPALTGPLGDPERTVVLHHPDCCPQIPCFSPDRPPHPGMASITVEEVVAAAQRLLAPANIRGGHAE